MADRGEAAGGPEGAADPSATPAGGFETGLSLPLLEGLVDELAIESREGGGNLVRMTLIRDLEEEPPE